MEKVSKNEPLISIVVPVYNVEQYLEKCVKSIVKQTYKNLEIILVDDGSPDKCGCICDKLSEKDKRIRVLHKNNGGLSDARNAGIDIATGRYISFIDSDDYIEKDYIKILYDSIKNDNSDMAIGAHTVLYENGTILKKATGEKSVLEPKTVLERILYDKGIDLSAWAKLYDINLFKKIRYPKGRLFEDAATTYKLIDSCKLISINSYSIYNYMIRNNSITGSTFSLKKMDLIISTQEMCDYIKEKYSVLENACNRRLMWAYLSTLSQLAMSKDRYINEEKLIVKYIRKNGFSILIDKNAPKRDKVGIISAMLGFHLYRFMWNFYRKITGRK